MTQAEVARELLKFIASEIVDSTIALTPDTDLKNIEGIDSMAMVQIILFIERKFDVTFTDEELNPQIFDSINILAQAVVNHN